MSGITEELTRPEEPEEKAPLSSVVIQCLADIEPEPISWLWPGKIALGKVSLIAGDPGLGKSIITAALAAIVTRGSTWPVDKTPCPQGGVIMLSAEDDPGDTIRPRLDAVDADVDHVFILTAIQDMNNDGELVERGFCLDRDIDQLDRLLAAKPDIRLVSVDPVTAYMGRTDSHNNSEVRAVLARLATIAARHKVAVVVVTHLNKSAQLNAMYRATGSLAFVAAARAVFAVTKDPAEPDRRLLLPIKNNLGDDRTGYAYQLVTADNGAPVLAWEPDPVETTLEEIAQAVTEHKPRPVEQAVAWLKSLLAAGPVLRNEIEEKAKADGHSWRSVERAKKDAGIAAHKRFDKKWEWSSPEFDPVVTALRQAAAESEIEDRHLSPPKPPVKNLAALPESGGLDVKTASYSEDRHNMNRGKVAALEISPELFDAATDACSGLKITAGDFIAQLETGDYDEIISNPAVARATAQSMNARK